MAERVGLKKQKALKSKQRTWASVNEKEFKDFVTKVINKYAEENVGFVENDLYLLLGSGDNEDYWKDIYGENMIYQEEEFFPKRNMLPDDSELFLKHARWEKEAIDKWVSENKPNISKTGSL